MSEPNKPDDDTRRELVDKMVESEQKGAGDPELGTGFSFNMSKKQAEAMLDRLFAPMEESHRQFMEMHKKAESKSQRTPVEAEQNGHDSFSKIRSDFSAWLN